MEIPGTRGWFNINMSSYQYRNSHYKCMIGNPYAGKMASLYWIGPLEIMCRIPQNPCGGVWLSVADNLSQYMPSAMFLVGLGQGDPLWRKCHECRANMGHVRSSQFLGFWDKHKLFHGPHVEAVEQYRIHSTAGALSGQGTVNTVNR